MIMPKAISLQSKLIQNAMLSSIVAGVLAWSGFVGLSGYQTMRMHDAWMESISEQLLGDITQSDAELMDDLSENYHIQYALYYEQERFTHSINVHLLEHVQSYPEGFHYIWRQQQLLRLQVVKQDGLRSYVVQPLAVRWDEVKELTFALAAILLVLWLLQWLILTWVVKQQLKPLRHISKAISQKSAQDLTPIPTPSTEIKELQPIVKQLNAMLSRVDRALVAEQRFTADASHELRSPLSAIHMRLQVVQRKYQQQTALQNDLSVIQHDLLRATQVLENLLTLARLDPEQAQALELKTMDLNMLLEDVWQSLKAHAALKKIQMQFDVADSIQIQANDALLHICLRNLIDNAIRYTPEAGMVNVRVTQIGSKTELRIENSGEGVSEHDVKHWGERFFRVLGTQTQGSGLGLSICKKVIELHQGSMHIQASPLGGLNIVITL